MKKREVLNIGEEFFYKGSIDKDIQYFNKFYNLQECYTRCSNAKISIYNYYYNLLKNNSNVKIYGIRSYNSMIIILHSILEKNGKLYYVMITPKYNWYKEISEEDYEKILCII